MRLRSSLSILGRTETCFFMTQECISSRYFCPSFGTVALIIRGYASGPKEWRVLNITGCRFQAQRLSANISDIHVYEHTVK